MSLAAAGTVLAGEVLIPGGWGGGSVAVLVTGLLLGLPHGAVDHLVPAWRLCWRPARLALFGLGYAALAAAAYLVFRAAPAPSLVVFVLISAWHFGRGETVFADLRAGRPVRPRPVTSLVLGGVVLLLPLARGLGDPDGDVAAVAAALVPGWNGAAPPGSSAAVAGTVGCALALGAVLLRQRRWLEVAELSVLVALAVVVAPLAAFGVYFGAWHSLRHIARVVAEDPANGPELAAGRLRRALRRFAVAAAVPTLAVLVVLAVLWSWAGGWRGLVATDLPLLAALTLPHVLVVGWLDRAVARQAGSRRIGTCGMPSST
jgi:Brp/Blh family beta-carotene 15,15'-monooxygenase